MHKVGLDLENETAFTQTFEKEENILCFWIPYILVNFI